MSQGVFKIFSNGLMAGIETPALLMNGIVNNTLFHSSPHIYQMLHQNTHIVHFVR